jgi:hypothetical protein
MAALIGLALIVFVGEVMWLSGTNKVEGEVLTYQQNPNSEIVKPVVAFVTDEGQDMYFLSSIGEKPNRVRYEEGERVAVFYRTDDPQDAQISGFIEQWGLVVLLIAIAFFIFLFSEMYLYLQSFTTGLKIYKNKKKPAHT